MTLQIRGFASVFGVVDGQGDVVVPGSLFSMSAEIMPAMMVEHQGDQVGAWMRATETQYGLYFEGSIYDTAVAEKVEKSELTGLSIGYRVKRARLYRGRRVITSAELIEVSLVTIGANQSCLIDAFRRKGAPAWTYRKLSKNGSTTSAISISAGSSIEASTPE